MSDLTKQFFSKKVGCKVKNKTIKYETTSSKLLYKGKILELYLDEVENSEKKRYSREVVKHSGGVAVVALTNDKEVFLVTQYRHPVLDNLLELPAGKLELGENPVECAIRELEEEVGVFPGKIEEIACFFSTPGFSSEKLYIYLATDLSYISRKAQEDEELEISIIKLDKAIDMAKTGVIKDGKTLIGLLLADSKVI